MCVCTRKSNLNKTSGLGIKQGAILFIKFTNKQQLKPPIHHLRHLNKYTKALQTILYTNLGLVLYTKYIGNRQKTSWVYLLVYIPFCYHFKGKQACLSLPIHYRYHRPALYIISIDNGPGWSMCKV